MDDSKAIEAFHLMWGNFPEPVALVHKSREVIAVNAICLSTGRMEAGMNCAKPGLSDSHKGCLANKALDARKAAFRKIKYGTREIISFWVPVDGYPELFVHFGVGVVVNYDEISESAIIRA
jgi:hypothetical protein